MAAGREARCAQRCRSGNRGLPVAARFVRFVLLAAIACCVNLSDLVQAQSSDPAHCDVAPLPAVPASRARMLRSEEPAGARRIDTVVVLPGDFLLRDGQPALDRAQAVAEAKGIIAAANRTSRCEVRSNSSPSAATPTAARRSVQSRTRSANSSFPASHTHDARPATICLRNFHLATLRRSVLRVNASAKHR